MEDAFVSSTEANRSFARLLRQVRDGKRIRITTHGETVAILSPPDHDTDELARRRAAMDRLMTRLDAQEPVVIGPWTKEDLYERDSWKKWQR